jgi:hypothetical protein
MTNQHTAGPMPCLDRGQVYFVLSGDFNHVVENLSPQVP